LRLKFVNLNTSSFSFYFHFSQYEKGMLSEYPLEVEDMNGKPLEVDGKIMKVTSKQIQDRISIDVEPYIVTIEPGKTYWAKVSYGIDDYVDKRDSHKEIHKWISFQGEEGSIQLHIPLTDFWIAPLRSLKIDNVTPSPHSRINDGENEVIIWTEPSSKVENFLTYEITIEYHYENNLFFIVSCLVNSIVIPLALRILYDKYFKKKLNNNSRARKEHLDELKEFVLNPMLTVLDCYSDTLKYTFNDFPETFKSIRPTQSKLFDVSDKHFPELMKNWKILEDELINHCQKCKFLYENIGKKLVKETGLAVHHTFNPNKQPFISESFQKLLWRSMFNKSLSKNALSGLNVKKSNYADAKEAHVLYWDGTTYAIGGNEEMKKCKVSFEQITEQVGDIDEVQSLLEKKMKLSEKIERIEDTIRDLLELKNYSGNCRYCP